MVIVCLSAWRKWYIRTYTRNVSRHCVSYNAEPAVTVTGCSRLGFRSLWSGERSGRNGWLDGNTARTSRTYADYDGRQYGGHETKAGCAITRYQLQESKGGAVLRRWDDNSWSQFWRWSVLGWLIAHFWSTGWDTQAILLVLAHEQPCQYQRPSFLDQRYAPPGFFLIWNESDIRQVDLVVLHLKDFYKKMGRFPGPGARLNLPRTLLYLYSLATQDEFDWSKCLYSNPFSWTNLANVLWVEQPVGVSRQLS